MPLMQVTHSRDKGDPALAGEGATQVTHRSRYSHERLRINPHVSSNETRLARATEASHASAAPRACGCRNCRRFQSLVLAIDGEISRITEAPRWARPLLASATRTGCRLSHWKLQGE
jgi:hypothetical protein